MFLANNTQKLAARILEAHIAQDRIAHSYIFSGREDASEMAEMATERNSTDIKEEFADRCIGLLARYAPNVPNAVEHRQIISPLDLERTFGLTGGNIMQGAMHLNQLYFLRPVPGWAGCGCTWPMPPRWPRPAHRSMRCCAAGASPRTCPNAWPPWHRRR